MKNIILSKREFEISRFFSLGFFAKEIASRLYLSIRTVETHRTNIYNKNESISNIADLVREFVLEFGNPKKAVFNI